MQLALSTWVNAIEITKIVTRVPAGMGIFGDIYVKFQHVDKRALKNEI
jgi:hypothetical protein